MVDFLYVHNYEFRTSSDAVYRSWNPLLEKDSVQNFGKGSILEDDGFPVNTAREEQHSVENSVAALDHVDGGMDFTSNCDAADFSPMDGSLRGGVLTMHRKIDVLGTEYRIPFLQTTSCRESSANVCAGSSNKNRHSFVSCRCDNREYCATRSRSRGRFSVWRICKSVSTCLIFW